MARRKITPGVDASDLPDLTPQQMKFVEGIIAGQTASDAYRGAYDVSNTSDRSIWALASRLRANVSVASWIDAIKAAGFGRVSCTYDEHMTELARLRGVAERTGNIGAAVQAEQLRGKVAGHYVDQVKDLTPVSAVDTLKDIAQHSPDLAAALAAQYNIEWAKPEAETAH